MRLRHMVRLILPAMLAAFVLASTGVPRHRAEARAWDVLGINPRLCLMLTLDKDWDEDGMVTDADGTMAFSDCFAGLDNPPKLRNLVRVLGGDPENPNPAAFAPIDLDANQLHEQDGAIWILAFVTNDGEVAFSADKGVFDVSQTANAVCGPMPDHDFTDEDCDDDAVLDDGVVVVQLRASGAPRGAATVTVNQTGVDTDLNYTITGEPSQIDMAVAEAVEKGSPSCDYPQSEDDWIQALADHQETVMTAQIRDSDGTPLTASVVRWQTDDAGKAVVAEEYGGTADLGTAGFIARNVLCGTDSTGQVTVTASISKWVYIGGTQAGIDMAAGSDSDSVMETVVSGAVGGMAEVPDTLESSDSHSGTLAAIATAMGLFAVVLATGGWYMRRRWLR